MVDDEKPSTSTPLIKIVLRVGSVPGTGGLKLTSGVAVAVGGIRSPSESGVATPTGCGVGETGGLVGTGAGGRGVAGCAAVPTDADGSGVSTTATVAAGCGGAGSLGSSGSGSCPQPAITAEQSRINRIMSLDNWRLLYALWDERAWTDPESSDASPPMPTCASLSAGLADNLQHLLRIVQDVPRNTEILQLMQVVVGHIDVVIGLLATHAGFCLFDNSLAVSAGHRTDPCQHSLSE